MQWQVPKVEVQEIVKQVWSRLVAGVRASVSGNLAVFHPQVQTWHDLVWLGMTWYDLVPWYLVSLWSLHTVMERGFAILTIGRLAQWRVAEWSDCMIVILRLTLQGLLICGGGLGPDVMKLWEWCSGHVRNNSHVVDVIQIDGSVAHSVTIDWTMVWCLRCVVIARYRKLVQEPMFRWWRCGCYCMVPARLQYLYVFVSESRVLLAFKLFASFCCNFPAMQHRSRQVPRPEVQVVDRQVQWVLESWKTWSIWKTGREIGDPICGKVGWALRQCVRSPNGPHHDVRLKYRRLSMRSLRSPRLLKDSKL